MSIAATIEHVAPGPAKDLRYSSLSRADFDAILSLHQASTGAVGRNDLVKPEKPDFFERILSGGGAIIGAWLDDALIGYGVLQLDLPPSEDARPYFGLTAEERLAKLAGACVLPSAWGGGIHDALIGLRVDEARRLGEVHLYATAAPGNARSWENLMVAGFAVRALVTKYGGHMRYLLYRDDQAPLPAPVDEGVVWCGVDDMARQQALLAEGLFGWGWRRREDGGREMAYRMPK